MFLLGASYYFYACFDLTMLPILLAVMGVAYAYGMYLTKTAKRSKGLFASIIVLLLLPLLLFKYRNYIPWPEYRGYEALNGVMQLAEGEKAVDVLSPSSAQSNIEERKLIYLQKFINDCKANNIKLVMCYSPYYGQAIPASIHIIEVLAQENDVPFLNYGDDVRFQNPKYFQDASHLNDTGAKEYSNEIVHALKTKY